MQFKSKKDKKKQEEEKEESKKEEAKEYQILAEVKNKNNPQYVTDYSSEIFAHLEKDEVS